MGIAGIGKSRLAWEFYKYFDGLVDNVYWHRGRCLAYGEGVTYWALADMVRMRARISEDDDDTTARSKLEATLSEHLLDNDERRFVEPLLASLLGIAEEQTSHERHDLFAAWRLFFERLANTYPTVLVFEDMQWADASLLDFVEYLLEWSRSSPLFVLVLARPELLDKRPNWGAGHRNFTSLHLGPLSEAAMTELLDGFVPGLPESLREQILARAEGVPLYAVETVRMLLDRGLLIQEGSIYRPTGEIPSLEVPETLHGLVASRLDGLPAEERRLLQDAAVLGKTFTRHALAVLAGVTEAELDPLLGSLARKEILGVQADPTSPEHGQYGFLQDLVRHVAYETLSKKERRTRHLAAAAYLVDAFPNEDEITEVLASHYLDAYTALPDAADAAEVKAKARAALVVAGDRAESLGAAGEALRYLEQAAELTDAPLDQAALLERAGWLGTYAADWQTAERLLGESIALHETHGDLRSAARVSGRLATVEGWQGKAEAALPRAEAAFATLEAVRAECGARGVSRPLSQAATSSAVRRRRRWRRPSSRSSSPSRSARRRSSLAHSLRRHSLRTGSGPKRRSRFAGTYSRSPASTVSTRSRAPSSSTSPTSCSCATVTTTPSPTSPMRSRTRAAEAIGRWNGAFSARRRTPLFMLGRWDEALAAFAEVPAERLLEGVTQGFLSSLPEIHVARGRSTGRRTCSPSTRRTRIRRTSRAGCTTSSAPPWSRAPRAATKKPSESAPRPRSCPASGASKPRRPPS